MKHTSSIHHVLSANSNTFQTEISHVDWLRLFLGEYRHTGQTCVDRRPASFETSPYTEAVDVIRRNMNPGCCILQIRTRREKCQGELQETMNTVSTYGEMKVPIFQIVLWKDVFLSIVIKKSVKVEGLLVHLSQQQYIFRFSCLIILLVFCVIHFPTCGTFSVSNCLCLIKWFTINYFISLIFHAAILSSCFVSGVSFFYHMERVSSGGFRIC